MVLESVSAPALRAAWALYPVAAKEKLTEPVTGSGWESVWGWASASEPAAADRS
jgi:hypothetical protein